MDVAAEGATPWRKWPAQPPWMEPHRVASGPSAGSTVRSSPEENAAISVQPLWWRRLGRSFIRGNSDDDALPVVQVKTAVWEWRWHKRRGEHRAAPWRWRTWWLNRRDDEIDDRSSSGTVDEGHRGVAVDDVVGEEAPAGWRTEQGVGFRRGFSRPRCTNGWADGMAVGNHGLETRLSEMWGKL